MGLRPWRGHGRPTVEDPIFVSHRSMLAPSTPTSSASTVTTTYSTLYLTQPTQ